MSEQQFLIAGGTGFIGQALVKALSQQHAVTVLGRCANKIQETFVGKGADSNPIKALTWHQLKTRGSQALKPFDAVINLAGCNIGDQLWSEKRKREILSSRVDSSNLLARLCAQLGAQSPRLLNASAIGIYGLQPSEKAQLPPAVDEDTLIDYYRYDDFLSKVGRHWELACKPAYDANVSVTNLRFAVVLGAGGGVLKRLMLPFYIGLGGRIGTGNQAFSWIALDDAVRAIQFILEQPSCQGPVNIVAPECVQQKTFAKTLGAALHRPALIPTPALAMKIVFGQMGKELLLAGQHVKPKRLQAAGFNFQYPTLKAALEAALLTDGVST